MGVPSPNVKRGWSWRRIRAGIGVFVGAKKTGGGSVGTGSVGIVVVVARAQDVAWCNSVGMVAMVSKGCSGFFMIRCHDMAVWYQLLIRPNSKATDGYGEKGRKNNQTNKKNKR